MSFVRHDLFTIMLLSQARKTSCAKKPSPAQIQHRQYLKNLRNMIQANVAKAKEDDDAEKAKRSSAAKSAEKQRQIVHYHIQFRIKVERA